MARFKVKISHKYILQVNRLDADHISGIEHHKKLTYNMKKKSHSAIGMAVSHLEAPFSCARVTAILGSSEKDS